MKVEVAWKDGMSFEGSSGAHRLLMDAKSPLGRDAGPTPKELVAMALGGCTSMDVIALLKKYRQSARSLRVEIDLSTVEGKHPAVFSGATIHFRAEGDIEPERLLEAVRLSQTRYCSVSGMLSKAFPIHYSVELNGAEIGRGEADFTQATKIP
ncbi:MAG TPA: OsmC family protein [Bdellovibrionales bacterium]|nr:OsmC family protein [Bdellovibrionales bacterium]